MVLLIVTGFWAQSIGDLVNGALMTDNNLANAPVVALVQH